MKVNCKKLITGCCILFLAGITSCLKDDIEQLPKGQAAMEDLIINETFDFSTSQEINLKITSQDMIGKPANKIQVYNRDPEQGGLLLKTGFSDIEQVFRTSFSIPAYLQELYIRRTTVNGLVSNTTVDVSGQMIEHTFTQSKKSLAVVDMDGPGCSDCDETISNTQNGNLKVNNNQTYCIVSGGVFTGNLKMQGGTLTVCGTLSPRNISGDGTIIINSGGVFSVSNLNINTADLTIKNYSDAFFVSGNNVNIGGTFINYANVSVNGVNNNANGIFENYGTFSVGSSFNNSSEVYNYGSLVVGGNFAINGNAVTENYCRISVGGNFQINYEVQNYSYIEVGGGTDVNGSGILTMSDQALLSTNDLTVNNLIEGEGNDYSKIIVADQTRINGSGNISGNIDLCDDSGIEANFGIIGATVTYCEAVIPETYCNPGAGSGGDDPDPDSDNDEVPDEFDEYPDDIQRAFNNYYPGEGEYGTLAFEDLWPSKGDYDFNDMVVLYNINEVTNAEDKIVELLITLKVKAIGAALENGFGIEFGASTGSVSEVTGDISLTQSIIQNEYNGIESGQDKAVVIFFDNAFDVLPHPGSGTGANTDPAHPWVEPQELTFHILFNEPVSEETLGMPPYNPFIFINKDRGREVHLKNYSPTSLASSVYLGTEDDDSDAASGRYYTTVNNLPWALNIVGEFDYPVEKEAIISAYNYFGDWAESDGIAYPDWFLDNEGYRNSEYIYRESR